LYFFKFQSSFFDLLVWTHPYGSIRTLFPTTLQLLRSWRPHPLGFERTGGFIPQFTTRVKLKTTKSADCGRRRQKRDYSTNHRSLPSISLDVPPTEKFVISYSSCAVNYTQN